MVPTTVDMMSNRCLVSFVYVCLVCKAEGFISITFWQGRLKCFPGMVVVGLMDAGLANDLYSFIKDAQEG